MDSPFFYTDIDGWHLKPEAPKEVQEAFYEYMENYKNDMLSAPDTKEAPPKIQFKLIP
jgi:hypothetical protein